MWVPLYTLQRFSTEGFVGTGTSSTCVQVSTEASPNLARLPAMVCDSVLGGFANAVSLAVLCAHMLFMAFGLPLWEGCVPVQIVVRLPSPLKV